MYIFISRMHSCLQVTPFFNPCPHEPPCLYQQPRALALTVSRHASDAWIANDSRMYSEVPKVMPEGRVQTLHNGLLLRLGVLGHLSIPSPGGPPKIWVAPHRERLKVRELPAERIEMLSG